MGHLKYCASAILIFLTTSSFYTISHATSDCDIALTSKAFNTNDYAQSSRLVLKKRDDVCKSEYNSQAEAESTARQSGGSIGYGGFSLGLSDAKQTSSGNG
jgi:hypothetical protein